MAAADRETGGEPMSETHDPVRELCKLLDEAGATVKFGLRAQGHIPTIERMLVEGRSWKSIGKEIGWDPLTAAEWYVRELIAARAAEATQHQQEIAALKKQVSGLSMECARRAEVIAAVEAERDQLYPTPEPETCEWREQGALAHAGCGKFNQWSADVTRWKVCPHCTLPLRLVPSEETPR